MALATCLAFAVALSTLRLQAQTAKLPAAPSNRFLCIYDISKPMHKHLAALQKSTREILQSRCSGQLHYGDTLGVWTFDQELHAGYFPLETWTPNQEDETKLRIAEFLKEQPTGKGTRLDRVMEGVAQVIQGPQITTVILFSTGNNPMQGTPFDQEINDSYKRALNEMKRNPMPIVTVLQARNGRFLKYTVNALPWPAVIPELPIPIKNIAATRPVPSDAASAAQLPSATPATNTASNHPVTSSPNDTPVAPLARVPPPKTLVLNPPAAAPSGPANTPALPPTQPPIQPTQSLAPTPIQPQATPPIATGPAPNFDAKPPMPNTPAPTPVPPAPTVISKPAPTAISTPAPKPPELPHQGPSPAKPPPPLMALTKPNPPPAPPHTTVLNAPASPAARPGSVPASPPLIAPSRGTNPPPIQTALAVPVAGNRSKTLLIAGVGLLCVAIVLLYMTLRRYRGAGEPSLITRSMGNLRK